MDPSPNLIIAVVGEADCGPELYAAAQEVGRLSAEGGAAVVCGGLGGVMEAACKGAFQAGAITIGILPGANRSDANAFVTVPIPTGMGEARNVLVIRAADAVIAVGGMFGTLSEIALALKIGKPVVGVATWELHRDGHRLEAFPMCQTPREAVDLAFHLAVAKR